MKSIQLSCKEFGNYDLVVVGGGCAGVFAAVRAARLGLKTAIVEKHNCFGGVATAGLVNVWHTVLDSDGKERVIAGLTEEVRSTLLKNGHAVPEKTVSPAIYFDPNVMKWELDKLAAGAGTAQDHGTVNRSGRLQQEQHFFDPVTVQIHSSHL